MEPIITFVKANLGVSAVVAILFIVLVAVSQKRMMPIVYHIIEFTAYFTVCHYALWCMVAVSAWYANETNPSEAHLYKTPGDLLAQNFADKALYTPLSLYYVEIGIVVLLMYLIVVVRPTNYSGRNTYKGDSERGMKSTRGRGGARYDRSRASVNRTK